LALGARPYHVLRLVMSQIFVLVMVGLAAGLALSAVIHLALQPFVYGVEFYDAPAVITAAAVLLTVAALAGYIPARRATSVDPTVALRDH
jgi:ABC-type antimicrobial peptide transport system permease subunit